MRSLQRDHRDDHVPGGCPFGHQVGEFGVVAELFLLDGGRRQDGHLAQLAEQVIQEEPSQDAKVRLEIQRSGCADDARSLERRGWRMESIGKRLDRL